MNVLFLSCWYPSEENPLKGIFIKEQAHAIHASGEKIVVLALNVTKGSSLYQKRIEKFIDEQGIETHIIHLRSLFYKWIYINPFYLYSILRTYYKKGILPDFNPDIIHSNILNPCAILGDWLSTENKKKHIISEHWSKIDNYMRKNMLSYYGRQAYKKATVITVVSNFLKSKVEKYIPDTSKVKIVPNVIDTDVFHFLPKKKIPDKIVFSCVATWNPPKQPMLFIKALEQISLSSSKMIVLNIVGEGIQLQEIKNSRTSYSIIYHGNIPKNEIAGILHNSDYFLHASRIETFSIVCAEALLTGTPVIASNVGALPELINSSNGILSENSVRQWSDAIFRAINTNYDNNSISKNMTDRFSKNSVAKLFKKIYDEINSH